ncbi:NADH dehydrogenase [Pseudonocardia sp. EC080610-09]|uniref:NAD(P)H-dependent oxidoreductase subunit E n=1 Tax=unclassified Pseudonocardia TaxID=2619320 RepID=UPI0006CB2F01|nr:MULTISPECIES: NAD(P)H-dependent oxidoreductase subunit E [unclassified Pseudonocardia]ALE73621.1 NADH dehydrogenase [Pseudonocardia sp. EC080625-04]ALL76846.1 NADH dehydrogenase [Pseudonocardia sp. EC080610-09]ALL83877.1 NADH dehydrogenase [Pseudonocardia sp. EC080619-01]
MDLHLSSAEPSTGEREAVDAAFALLAPSAAELTAGDRATRSRHAGHAARSHRHLLLPLLHAVHDAEGWLSEGALNHVARTLQVPPAEVYGVATFYAMFSVEPRAPRVVHVCDDVACGPAGGEEIAAALGPALGPEGTGSGPDGAPAACWVRSPCLGLCERAPAVLHQRAGEPDLSQAPATPSSVLEAASAPADPSGEQASAADRAFADATVSAPQTRTGAHLRLLRRVGVVDPSSLDDYRSRGGYAALRRAVDLGPTRVIAELKDSSLTGRGGAAFPTGVKWEGVAQAPERPHHLVCNADESEPGTFKDRVLMEGDPFGLVEAMTIAGYVTGATVGHLYIRGEYPLATRRLQDAIAAARARGLLGDDVMGEGFAFDIDLRRGAGAYICGEETALLESIEGYRGEPRNKPPFPASVGLFGKPTAINNVETLYNVLEVLDIGGQAFAGVGGGRSTGSKLFCVSGAVGTPGVYEVDFGTTLRQLLDLAGGARGSLRTVLLGGAAGGFVLPGDLDVVLTLEGARDIGATLGSGVVLVFDEDADLTGTLRRIAAFFRDESCGQCVPCRVGTVRQEEALARLERNAPIGSRETEIALLDDLARVMRDASICGLGQTAPSAVTSAIDLGLIAAPPRDRSSTNGHGGTR